MFTYISVISILVIIIVYLISDIIVLKNKLRNLQYLYNSVKHTSNYWRSVAEIYKRPLSDSSNTKELSEKDLKSLISMVHPDRHPESRKQRATELFIKLKEIQGSKL